MIHPVAFAGWAGILVTMLNLLPVGTLDGGHVAYALFGEKARYLFIPVLLVALIGLGFLWNGWWLWAVLIFFLRPDARPTPRRFATPLDPKRKLIAIIALIVFVLTFTPLPLTIYM